MRRDGKNDSAPPAEPGPARFAGLGQPLTPGGVAAFAHASLGRLLAAELIVALFVSFVGVWFLRAAWFPVVREAIQQLPEHGGLLFGELQWDIDTPRTLAEGKFLAIVVDLEGAGSAGRVADLQIELGRKSLKLCSLFGCLKLPYPQGWVVGLNRTELSPWWDAWQLAMLVGLAALIATSLIVAWSLLAAVYAAPVRLLAFLYDLDAGWLASWRLASAALLPGALFFAAALFLYRVNVADLVRLLFASALHFVVGWIYLLVSPFFLPRISGVPRRDANPFARS